MNSDVIRIPPMRFKKMPQSVSIHLNRLLLIASYGGCRRCFERERFGHLATWHAPRRTGGRIRHSREIRDGQKGIRIEDVGFKEPL